MPKGQFPRTKHGKTHHKTESEGTGPQYILYLGKEMIKGYRNKYAALMRKKELGEECFVWDTIREVKM